jgi:gamma-glutamylcyclotransferase (GGCT)/AIG2-like uncharacterized protein YtfP
VALIFLNGAGMSGGPLHHHLRGAPLVRIARTAPRYRYYAVGGRFPAMCEVGDGGYGIAGEVYDVPLEVLLHDLMPAEPPALELGVIELDDGTACLATVLRRDFRNTAELLDISAIGDWRAYLAGQLTVPDQ